MLKTLVCEQAFELSDASTRAFTLLWLAPVLLQESIEEYLNSNVVMLKVDDR
ncbi:hypothetical protein O9929_07870 [Vibrio lentus]|nr:hypothetical protein [Vibrio lentus]